VKKQNWASIILYLAVLFQLLGMSGWLDASLTQPVQLATLVLMLTAILTLRKKKRKRKKAAGKPPAEVDLMLDRAQEGGIEK
jgi:chromate transport protein ChrA